MSWAEQLCRMSPGTDGPQVLPHSHDLYIPIAGGGWIATDGEHYEVGAEITVYTADWQEIGHWAADEWKEDPEAVMGAFLRLVAATTKQSRDRFRTPDPMNPIPEEGEFNPPR